MSIRKENNGTYTLCYTKHDVITNKNIRTVKRGFETLKEAKEYERNVSRETSIVTFYSLFEECQKGIEQEPETLTWKRRALARYLPAFMTIRYEELTKSFLLETRNLINSYDLVGKTKNNILELITQTCNFANTIYDLPDNSKVMKRFKIVTKEFDIWSPEEFKQFYDSIPDKYEDCKIYFRTLFFTGIRKSEARALTVDDLDVENKCLIINKSMRHQARSLKAPKTPSSVRKVKLDDYTFEMLLPLKANEKWLFGDYKPISKTRIDRVFTKYIKISGVKPIRIHDLRHSHASYLIGNGANIVAVSKRLGHASINVTLKTYAHVIKESEDKLVSLLENIKM